MKKLANFIVDRRRLLLTLVLAVAAGCAVLAVFLQINKDMTRYLPDSSNMRQGLDIMDTDFPASEDASSIRVMFDDLNRADTGLIRDRLESIPYVSHVSYEADSAEYNRDNHTLFVVSSGYGYETDEEKSIETAIGSLFPEYSLQYQNNDVQSTKATPQLLTAAVAMALAVLLIMSRSWLEPVLFIATIGTALIINLGTNAVFPYTSEMTFSIGPIIQLVLSMDYSIILMNRYRQEKPRFADKSEAMKAAIAGAAGSVMSSAMTTVVGLLALVFLSFKIGPELGIVLAKGVFISMLCVFTVLPVLILRFDAGIEKSMKKSPHVPTLALARLSYRARYIMPVIFAGLFALFFVLKSGTGITFTEGLSDPLSQVFPKDNTLVLLYNNEDEDSLPQLISRIEQDTHVKSVMGYTNTLGSEYTASEMSEAISLLGEDSGSRLDTDILQMLYCIDEGCPLPEIATGEFLAFVADKVLNSGSFSEYVDEEFRDKGEYLKKLSDSEALISALTADEMAEFLGLDHDTAEKLYLYYFVDQGGVYSGRMTLPVFADFVLNSVANDPDYSSMLDSAALSELSALKLYTDAAAMTKPLSYSELAPVIGADSDTTRLIYSLYQAGDESYQPRSATLAEFISFVQGSVMAEPLFAGSLDSEAAAQINALAPLCDKDVLAAPMPLQQLAAVLGMDEGSLRLACALRLSGDMSYTPAGMTVPQFVLFLQEDVAVNPAFAAYLDPSALTQISALSPLADKQFLQTPLSAAELASIVGMDESLAVFVISNAGSAEGTMTPYDFLGALLSDPAVSPSLDEQTRARLQGMLAVAQLVLSDTPVSQTQAALFGMDEAGMRLLLAYYDARSTVISIPELVDYMLGDSTVTASLSEQELAGLIKLRQIIGLVQNDVSLSWQELGALAGLDDGSAKLLFTYRDALLGLLDETPLLSVQEVLNFIAANGDLLSGSSGVQWQALDTARGIINASVAGTRLSAGELAQLLGIEPQQANSLYLLYRSETGGASDWVLSPQALIGFAAEKIPDNSTLSAYVDASTAQELSAADRLISAVLSGEEQSYVQMSSLLSGLGDSVSARQTELMYIYYAGLNGDSSYTMTIPALFEQISTSLAPGGQLAELADEKTREDILHSRDELDAAIDQLRGDRYSRLVISSDYPDEDAATSAFVAEINAAREELLSGDSYLVGTSEMVYEMDNSFDREFTMISLITAAAIFLVVLLTFRGAVVPALLTLLVQCGVFITVTVIGAFGGSMYYLALLIVQSILMGATIDYGIVFSSYYRESRQSMDKAHALEAAYDGSIHTIMTSGSILVLVLAVLGIFSKAGITAQVCKTLSIGALVAVLLILLVLPGTLAFFDRFIAPKTEK